MANDKTSGQGDVFRALADPTRREVLRMLRAGPLTSGEIANRFDATWPAVSRHLAVLRDAGLVVSLRQKQEIRYELNTSVLQDLGQRILEWAAPGRAAGSQRAKMKSVPRAREA